MRIHSFRVVPALPERKKAGRKKGTGGNGGDP